ncbi:MAG: response regulator transcription factor [Rickettsiales bacterium]
MTDTPPHILVVDDDKRLRELLTKFLREEGFLVTPAIDAKDARKKQQYFDVDLIVLDRMMPGENGVEFARSVRQISTVPILMLTAMGEVEARIDGLEAGVDDYLSKPFEPKELLLRIRSILKRSAPNVIAQDVQIGQLRFDLKKAQLWKGEEHVYLTESETQLILALINRQGETLSRQELARLSGDSDANERSVDVLVTRLRKKIEPNPAKPLYLHTVRGVGYVLKV